MLLIHGLSLIILRRTLILMHSTTLTIELRSFLPLLTWMDNQGRVSNGMFRNGQLQFCNSTHEQEIEDLLNSYYLAKTSPPNFTRWPLDRSEIQLIAFRMTLWHSSKDLFCEHKARNVLVFRYLGRTGCNDTNYVKFNQHGCRFCLLQDMIQIWYTPPTFIIVVQPLLHHFPPSGTLQLSPQRSFSGATVVNDLFPA